MRNLGTFLLLLTAVISILLTCTDPTNPYEDRNNVKATITVLTPESGWVTDSIVSFILQVDLLDFIDSVKVIFGDDSPLTVKKADVPADWKAPISHIFRSPGADTLYGIIYQDDGSKKTTETIVVVIKTHLNYFGNGQTSGEAPFDQAFYYKNDKVTVRNNTGNLAKSGYDFGGWNTMPNGTGTIFLVGSEFTITFINNLYALWSQSTKTVTYNGNGNTGGTVPVDAATYAPGVSVTVKPNAGALVRTGYSFAGWDTLATGTGVAYAEGATLVMGHNNVTLYAKWVLLSPAKALTSFGFVSPSVTGAINETAHTVTLTVPSGTNAGNLIAKFTTTGASVKIGNAVQTSESTPNNFTSAVIYTVTAVDGSTQEYVITVTVASSSEKALTVFGFVSPAVSGSIDDATKTILVNVPFGTDVTALQATFTTTGASIKVGNVVQVNGSTSNNFTSPVVYTVAAADGTLQPYTVTVKVASNSAKAITSFSFAGTVPVSVGTIDTIAKTIAITIPYGTSKTSLVATFITTGTSVTVGGVVQTSGTSALDFSNAVTYIVTAADATTQPYVVTVTNAKNPAKTLTAFSFASLPATGIIDQTAKTVAVTVPYTTTLTNLVATFATNGAASVKVGTAVQVSGSTFNDFSVPVTYIVTAEDETFQNYVVTVNKALQAPVLTSPADGAAGLNVAPTLVWNSVTNAVTYHVQVSTNNAFSSVLTEDSTLTTTSKTLSGLSNNTTYYWRVRAKNAIGTSPWASARFITIRQYTLSITQPATGTIAKGPISQTSYDSGYIVTITANPTSGFHFVSWGGNKTGTTNPDTVIMNSNKTISATFASNPPNTFALSVNATNGSVTKTPNNSQALYDSGSTVGLKAHPDMGYHFVNWSGDTTGSVGDSSFVNMTSAKNVSAIFAINTYLLTSSTSIGGTITIPTISPIAVNYGTPTTITAAPSAGYTFINWTTPLGSATIANVNILSTTATLTTGDATVKAIFTADYTVTFDDQHATTSVSPSTKTIHYPATTIESFPTEPQKTNWIFAGWWTDTNGTGTQFTTKTIVSQNMVVYAHWSRVTCTVAFNSQGGSTVPPLITYYGFTVGALPTPTYDDCIFKGWFIDSLNISTSPIDANSDIIGNTTFYARWAVKDIEENEYKTVKIGNQTWMAENLKTTKYRDGTSITNDTSFATWKILHPDSAKYCWYNNDSSNKNPYGPLYNWYTVAPSNQRQLAPRGWHVPTYAEWIQLSTYVGGVNVAGGKLKELGYSHWLLPNNGADNSTGFSALPGGYCLDDFNEIGNSFSGWSSSEYSAFYAYGCCVGSGSGYLLHSYYNKNFGFSIRLVKD